MLLILLFFFYQVNAKCWYQKATCEVDGVSGICADSSNSNCCAGGKWTSGLCPGKDHIQCCTSPTCVTKDEDAGVCLGTSQCGSTPTSGLCSGPNDLQCCLSGKKAKIEKDESDESDSEESQTSDYYGIDVSSSISKSTWECMKESTLNIDWVIVRAYRSTGKVDTRACASLKAAKDAKISLRDAYIFPCPPPKCPNLSGEQQVKDTVANLKSCDGNPWNGVLWLDIEGTQYWSTNKTVNEEFFESMLDGCRAKNIKCDVYTSKSQWDPIMGNSQKGKDMRLWYAHYQTPPQTNFNKWKAFGGWTKPFAKQYQGDVEFCGVTTDKNWSPNDPTPASNFISVKQVLKKANNILEPMELLP